MVERLGRLVYRCAGEVGSDAGANDHHREHCQPAAGRPQVASACGVRPQTDCSHNPCFRKHVKLYARATLRNGAPNCRAVRRIRPRFRLCCGEGGLGDVMGLSVSLRGVLNRDPLTDRAEQPGHDQGKRAQRPFYIVGRKVGRTPGLAPIAVRTGGRVTSVRFTAAFPTERRPRAAAPSVERARCSAHASMGSDAVRLPRGTWRARLTAYVAPVSDRNHFSASEV